MDLKRKLAQFAQRDQATAAATIMPASLEPRSVRESPDDARAERIQALRGMIDALVARKPPPPPAPEPRALPGECEVTPHGELRVVRTYFPPDHHHGRTPIAHALAHCAAGWRRLGMPDCDPRGLLLLDTETTGLSGGTGTIPFLIGLGWFEDESLCVEQLFVPRPGEESPALERLRERIASATCLVTYNGKSYDWPLLRTRGVLNRVALPEPERHLDLLHPTRRIYRRRLGSVRLVEIEAALFGLHRDRDISGAEIPSLYWDYVRGRDQERMPIVFEHNTNDIVALAALLGRLLGALDQVSEREDPSDLYGMALVSVRAGDFSGALDFASAAARLGTGEASHLAALLAARLHRRERRRGEACAVLERALEQSAPAAETAALHLALAKLLERWPSEARPPADARRADLERALDHAQRAADHEGHAAAALREARLRSRIVRLEARRRIPAKAEG